MGLFNFHLPKNNKFSYTPRYYDERKERLEKLKKEHENPDKALIEKRIRGKLKRHEKKNPFAGTGFRFFLILAILLLITYLLLSYFEIPLW